MTRRRSRRHDRHGGLTVLDRELDRHAETFLYTDPAGVGDLSERQCSWYPGGGTLRGCIVFILQSPVALAMSSPTFLGDRPRGPILGGKRR